MVYLNTLCLPACFDWYPFQVIVKTVCWYSLSYVWTEWEMYVIKLCCSKTWLIWNSSDQKKVFWMMKNLNNSILLNQLTISLKKLVLLLLVWYAITCHVITVTNYHFTWCSVVINVMFNTVKPPTIVSERTAKHKWWMWESYLLWIIWVELYENYHYRADFSFELQTTNVSEIVW
jgi:hypothetical protein